MKKQSNIIGVGRLGSKIALEFEAYPEYRIYTFDTEHRGKSSFELDVELGIEEYEREFPTDDAKIYLRKIKNAEQVFLFVEGGDPISGIILRLLSLVKDSKITVVYLCPEREIVSPLQKRDDKLIFGALQEYARSGLFESICVVDKSKVDILLGDTTIQEYEKSFSYFVSYLFAMINFFNNTDPVISKRPSPSPIDRICTLSVHDLEEGTASSLYSLEKPSYTHLYYGVPEENDDNKIISKIKSHAKQVKGDVEHTTYSVHETSLEKVMVLSQTYTSKVQVL